MSEIFLKADINECKVENWQSNTGEVDARELKVEMCDELSSCEEQFVTFELKDGTIYESRVVDGKAKIPSFTESHFIKIGLYAENVTGEKRYSPRPYEVYVSSGSYKGYADEPPKPAPGDYAELLKEIKRIDQDTKEYVDEMIGALDEVSDMLGGDE